MAHRMSALPIAQYCGRSASLSLGAGRAAALSTAFHALSAKAPDAEAKLSRLTPEEREALAELKTPTDTTFEGFAVRYSEAHHELEVGLTPWASHCAADDPDLMSLGHLDMAWIFTLQDGRKVALVGDIKLTEWTATDGPDSLQLVAYGFAYAALHGCDLFACGIWDATGGQWSWGAWVDLASEEAMALWSRVKHAAQNVGGDYAMGPHCSGCYSRQRCPAYFLPPEEAEGLLAKYAAGGITADNAVEVKLLIDRVKASLEPIEDNLKEHARRLPIVYGDKQWKPVPVKGRESFDKKNFAADHPELVAKYTKQGKGYDQFRWVKRS